MGTQALKSHAAGEKHEEITQKISCFFKANPSINVTNTTNKEKSVAEVGSEPLVSNPVSEG